MIELIATIAVDPAKLAAILWIGTAVCPHGIRGLSNGGRFTPPDCANRRASTSQSTEACIFSLRVQRPTPDTVDPTSPNGVRLSSEAGVVQDCALPATGQRHVHSDLLLRVRLRDSIARLAITNSKQVFVGRRRGGPWRHHSMPALNSPWHRWVRNCASIWGGPLGQCPPRTSYRTDDAKRKPLRHCGPEAAYRGWIKLSEFNPGEPAGVFFVRPSARASAAMTMFVGHTARPSPNTVWLGRINAIRRAPLEPQTDVPWSVSTNAGRFVVTDMTNDSVQDPAAQRYAS